MKKVHITSEVMVIIISPSAQRPAQSGHLRVYNIPKGHDLGLISQNTTSVVKNSSEFGSIFTVFVLYVRKVKVPNPQA